MDILLVVFSGFGLALAAPWLYRWLGKQTGWLLSLLPLAITLYLAARYLDTVAAGEVVSVSFAWAPSLDINLSFYLDGLSLIFSLLIAGVGTVVVIYGGRYLARYPHVGRFFAFILLFMASMLGVVLAGNLLTLFIFWELTSLSSYLLIGFNHKEEASRSAALQALLVTGGGGLALMAGLLLLGLAAGSFEFGPLLAEGGAVRQHTLYLPLLLLILLGAFTKSAQFPFHFWLPAAMAAPTPVSAYLHSATMVKAGVYLLARLSPVLGGTPAWQMIVTLVGATTMVVGALVAIQQKDLKRILAYSTVSALGTLVLLLGLGTRIAVEAAVLFLLVHSLYKGALFLVAGILDQKTGTRDVTQLSGLGRLLPVTATAATLAALSMAGIPFLVGFLSKELFYEAVLHTPQTGALLTGAGVLANAVMVAVAATLVLGPFTGLRRETPDAPEGEAAVSLWLGPLLLGGLGLLFGLFPALIAGSLIAPAASAVLAEPVTLYLALWHGFNVVLALSGLTLALGLAIYVGRNRIRSLLGYLDPGSAVGPQRVYGWSLQGLLWLAGAQTRLLQNGHLRSYVVTIVVTTVGLVGFTLLSRHGLAIPVNQAPLLLYEGMAAGIILLGVFGAVTLPSRLGAVASLGVVGYGVALIFVLFGAPDLAMTVFAIETLSVILFVMVFFRLPRFSNLSSWPRRVRDMVVSVAAGALMTALILTVSTAPTEFRLKEYFIGASWPLARGRNVVNVILVDFRGLDTLGEITVLAVAGIAVFALLKLRLAPAAGEQSPETRAGAGDNGLHPTISPPETEPLSIDELHHKE
jgi:multicomponent Na+:H+ antiporter subunit A